MRIPRRALLPTLLLLLGTGAALLVTRLPRLPDRLIVTRRHGGPDPLLTAVLLRFNTESLLHHPSRYFRPPFLSPDPNPLRGTEPLVAETILALPLRFLLGDRPALVLTVVRVLTLALLAFATGLMLRELGVRDSLALLAGLLTVLVSTTVAFFDRLQAVSLQWLPLAVLFAARSFRHGRRRDQALFALSVFLVLQSSLYTSVMLLGLSPFLLPLLLTLRGVAGAGRRLAGLVLGAVAAAAASLLVLAPYLTDRWDVAVYASADYAPAKSWQPAALADFLSSPPEYGRWPFEPAPSWTGYYPGAAPLLTLAWAATLGLAVRGRRALAAPPGAAARAFRISGWAAAVLGAGLAGAAAGGALAGAAGARLLADACLWGLLLAWCVRLAVWPSPWSDEASGLGLLASAAGLSAFVLLLMGLGSPIVAEPAGPPLLRGLFAPLSALLPPLREMRELRRCLSPAGWSAVVAVTLALERLLRRRPLRFAPVLVAIILALAGFERLFADTRAVRVPAVPAPYALLGASQGSGGLLELPYEEWNRVGSIHRMLWQPSHGRAIAAGCTGLDPAWYAPARQVFNDFPSAETLLLLRAWGLDSVLDGRSPEAPEPRAEGIVLRASREASGLAWRLFDVRRGDSSALAERTPQGPGSWESPLSAEGPGTPTLAVDGSADTAADLEGPAGLILRPPPGARITAVELDYGRGRYVAIPPQVRVLGLVGEEWRDLTVEPTGDLLRARVANLLMKRRPARLVVGLHDAEALRLRLSPPAGRWELPEVRLWQSRGGPLSRGMLPSSP